MEKDEIREEIINLYKSRGYSKEDAWTMARQALAYYDMLKKAEIVVMGKQFGMVFDVLENKNQYE